MGKFDNYRSSNDYREILRILQKATLLQDNFLWQTHGLGKNVISIHRFEIDFVSREVVFYFDQQRFQVDKELPLYVKLDYRGSVFKISDYRFITDAISFPFPVEIKTMELRANPRRIFLPSEEKYISVKPSQTANRSGLNELQFRVLDISTDGLALLVSEQNRTFLKNNQTLCITKLGDFSLTIPVNAEVIYINNEGDPRYHNKKNKNMKVGFKLSGNFPQEIYQRFIE